MRINPSKDTLIAMDEHIHYELEMFFNAVHNYEKILNNNLYETSVDLQMLKNIFVESIGMHIRCLNCFFFGKSNYDGDILAEHFFDNPSIWIKARQPYFQEKEMIRIN